MHDSIYCYPDSSVLKNKLNIKDGNMLFQAEMRLTFIRLKELEQKPIQGKFDFNHLKKIHKFIFQDIYSWAGKTRTVNIGKGNLFCVVPYIPSYASTIFDKYYSQCKMQQDDKTAFVKALADNYADLNALHPFREGNGRAQREFAREVCLSCGYIFDLSNTKHEDMLLASQLSFNRGDNSLFYSIFNHTVIPQKEYQQIDFSALKILASDDLTIYDETQGYDYYEAKDRELLEKYTAYYHEKITAMKKSCPKKRDHSESRIK